jgi:hypothetical protein
MGKIYCDCDEINIGEAPYEQMESSRATARLGLQSQQPSFHRQPVAGRKAAQSTAGRDNAVAGHNQRRAILSHDPSHSACRTRPARRQCKVAVAACGAKGDSPRRRHNRSGKIGKVSRVYLNVLKIVKFASSITSQALDQSGGKTVARHDNVVLCSVDSRYRLRRILVAESQSSHNVSLRRNRHPAKVAR